MGNKTKKKNEQECFNLLVSSIKQHQGKSRQFIKLIANGTPVYADSERPDFILQTYNEGSELVIGIEHFQCDGNPIYKKNDATGKTIISSGYQKRKNKYLKTYERHTNTAKSPEHLSVEIKDALKELIVEGAYTRENVCFADFVNSFKYAYNEHIQSTSIYIQNIKEKAKAAQIAPSDIKLVFLVEVHTPFNHLFVFDGKELRFEDNYIVPMFTEIIDIIRNAHRKHVDYIAFVIYDVPTPGQYKTIIVDTQSIDKSLQRQKISVYNYLAANRDKPTDSCSKFEVKYDENGDLNVGLHIQINEAAFQKRLEKSFIYAISAYEIENNKNAYVTDFQTEYIKYILRKPLSESYNKDGTLDQDKFILNYKKYKHLILSAINDFDKKWGAILEESRNRKGIPSLE